MRELNRKMANGVAWMAALKVCVRSIALVSTVILARLLVPADFGLIAMATSVIALMQLATALSFDIPLIQNQNADRSHFDTAWTLNIVFHVCLTALAVFLAGPAANFYSEQRLEPVIYVLAAGFLATGFNNIGVVYFRKNLDFRKDFWVLLSKKLIGFAVTIPLALLMRSYWALVTGMVVGNIVSVAATYFLHPYRPRFSLTRASEMLGYSKWLVLNNSVQFFRLRSADFIIGRVSGSSALGLFSIAYEISVLPITEIVAPINRVTYPAFAKLSADMTKLRESVCDSLAVIAICALPAGLGISAVASPLVDLVLGAKWTDAAPLISILAVFGAIHSLHTNSGSVFNAIGKPYLITLTGFCNIGVLIFASIVLVLEFGLIGIAAAYLGTSILLTPFNFYILCSQIGLSARGLIDVLWRPLLSGLIMYVTIISFDRLLLSIGVDGPGSRLLALIPSGIFVYCISLLGMWIIAGAKKSVAEYRLAKLVWNKAADVIAKRD